MPNREIKEQRPPPVRYTPEKKAAAKREADARRTKGATSPMNAAAKGLGADMARGVQGLKNRSRDLDKAIEEQGG